METERLILRRFTMDDAQAMFDLWTGDPAVAEYCVWPAHESVDVSRELIALWMEECRAPDRYEWCIEVKGVGPRGSIGIVKVDEEAETVEIGYCLSRGCWGMGYVPEAAQAVIRLMFETVGARRVTAKHDVDNPKSGRVMQKCGMRYLETRKNGVVNNHGLRDVAVYAIDRIDAHPLTEAHKREICAWRYDGEYSVYNLPAYEEMARRQSGFMNPARTDNYIGFSVDGELVGFVNLLEEPDEVFVGIGVHPEHVNKGFGRRILTAASQIAREKYPGKPLYLEVRTWNERALRCYRRAGFSVVGEPFEQTTGAGTGIFCKLSLHPIAAALI